MLASSVQGTFTACGIQPRESRTRRAYELLLLSACREIAELQLEFEASQRSAIFATIILNVRLRRDGEARRHNKR
jgi:hypothetical protein